MATDKTLDDLQLFTTKRNKSKKLSISDQLQWVPEDNITYGGTKQETAQWHGHTLYRNTMYPHPTIQDHKDWYRYTINPNFHVDDIITFEWQLHRLQNKLSIKS